jgi:hypothetical protein
VQTKDRLQSIDWQDRSQISPICEFSDVLSVWRSLNRKDRNRTQIKNGLYDRENVEMAGCNGVPSRHLSSFFSSCLTLSHASPNDPFVIKFWKNLLSTNNHLHCCKLLMHASDRDTQLEGLERIINWSKISNEFSQWMTNGRGGGGGTHCSFLNWYASFVWEVFLKLLSVSNYNIL